MVARALRLPVADDVRNGRERRLQRSLESALSIGRVYGAHVFDRRGDLAASVGSGADRRAPPRDVTTDGRRTGAYSESEGEPIYSYFVPLFDSGQNVIGTLQVTRRKRDFTEFMARVRRRGFFVLALGIATMAAIVLVGYHNAVGRSLLSFAMSIRQVRAGRRDCRASVRSPKEVAVVASSFNAMLDAIAEAEARLRSEYTLRASLERRLRQSERLAEIGRLAAGLAHELGTPLSVVDGHAQRALRDASLAPVLHQRLEVMRQQVAHMVDLVQQLLEYGRTEQRPQTLLEAGRVANRAVVVLEEHAARHGVRVLATARGEHHVLANETRIHQALVNLIKNAIESAKTRVTASVYEEDALVVFTVDDDGPGIAPANRGRIYDPFFTTKDARGGTGLGLAIVESVAREHDGSIEDGSAPLGGARLQLKLPRAKEPETPSQESS
jgi:signal transduction histidine kinase